MALVHLSVLNVDDFTAIREMATFAAQIIVGIFIGLAIILLVLAGTCLSTYFGAYVLNLPCW